MSDASQWGVSAARRRTRTAAADAVHKVSDTAEGEVVSPVSDMENDDDTSEATKRLASGALAPPPPPPPPLSTAR